MDLQQVNTVKKLTTEILIFKQQAAVNIIEIGRRLYQVKEMLPHGEWGNWLEKEVEFTDRTAQNFMRVAREFSNTKAISDLSPTKVIALLDVPAEEREQFIQESHELPTGETKTVNEMTTRELQKTLKAWKEAERKAQEAERKLAEALGRPEPEPQVVEKEVIPQEIQSQLSALKSENKELREKEFQLKTALQLKEIDEKDKLQKARLSKKALDEEFTYLAGDIKRFLERVSRYTLLADALMRMKHDKVKEHQEALNQLETWLNAMKRAMPYGGNPIDIEGVYIDVNAD